METTREGLLNEPPPGQGLRGSIPESVGQTATYLWLLAAAVVLVLWLRDPTIFTPESMATLMRSWGSWVFGGFLGVALVRGLFLVPSTPVVLAGGILFPGSLITVFAISLAGIVLSATVLYLMPGVGGYDNLLERKYPGTIMRVRPHLEKPRAFWVVAAWSFFPLVPTDVICYVSGLVRMSYWRMIAALLLGEIPLIVAYLVLTQRIR